MLNIMIMSVAVKPQFPKGLNSSERQGKMFKDNIGKLYPRGFFLCMYYFVLSCQWVIICGFVYIR